MRLTTSQLYLLGGLFNVAGGTLFRRWADVREWWLLVLGCCFYATDTFIWASILKRGADLSTGAVLWSATSLLIAIAVGLAFFDETLSSRQLLGSALVLAGILLCW